jgi:predicted amino acid-binding ACT domain protein
MNKSLPPAPPEQSADQAHDRVGLLNAQLRALANRRININRSIAQMTELMPTDKLMNSAEVVRKRETEKRKVEVLKQELADVQREEYELGLKLHRAYKRLDREAEWEPTTLWVRRVTG